MNDNLPPLPPYAPEFKPRWATDPGGYNEDQMKAYARAAIERQSVPAGYVLVPIEPTEAMTDATYVGQHCSDIWRDMIAAAPQPEPGPMAETVEEAARDVQKCLNERDGHGLDLRHVAMLVHHVQQSQGEKQ